eukprot:symbB.v1.2.006038.t1/scaffold339.1/size225540/2
MRTPFLRWLPGRWMTVQCSCWKNRQKYRKDAISMACSMSIPISCRAAREHRRLAHETASSVAREVMNHALSSVGGLMVAACCQERNPFCRQHHTNGQPWWLAHAPAMS